MNQIIPLLTFLFLFSCTKEDTTIAPKPEKKKTRYINQKAFCFIPSGTHIIEFSTLTGVNPAHYISIDSEIPLPGDSVTYNVMSTFSPPPTNFVWSYADNQIYEIQDVNEYTTTNLKMVTVVPSNIVDDGNGAQYIKYISVIIDLP